MKKLALKDDPAVYQNIAETAYSPPAQADAFNAPIALDNAGTRLLSFLERMERLEDEKQAIVDDQKEVMDEAKNEGWDVAAIRALLKIRRDDDAEAKLAMLKTYHDSVGMLVWPA